ncbi:MAG: tRNA-binding protein [Candidatus Aenigmarchaeota archaeon]|nr:tRNA-binding protein [Candidatus Aenigmarchaeota archaeon]
MSITWQDFEKVDMRVGRVVSAEDFPQARKPAYKLKIDFGSEVGTKQTSAQITKLYSKEELIGKQVVAVVNFPPKNIAGFMSEVLVLGVVCDGGEVILLQPERDAPLGKRIA